MPWEQESTLLLLVLAKSPGLTVPVAIFPPRPTYAPLALVLPQQLLLPEGHVEAIPGLHPLPLALTPLAPLKLVVREGTLGVFATAAPKHHLAFL